MSDIATASHEIKKALVDAARGLFESDKVHVSFGHPGTSRDRADLVAFTEIRTEQTPATLSTNRSRDEDVYVTAMISCFRAGEEDDDLVPSDAAYGILRALERHVRITDTTLGGRCMWCFVSNTNSGGVTDPKLLARGRLIQIEAEFKARVRITT